MRSNHPLLLRLAVLLLGLLAAPVAAQDYHWTSPVTGNWNDAARWTPNGTPNGAGQTATLDAAGSAYLVTLNLDASLDAFTLNSLDASLFASGRVITVNGPSSFAAGDSLLRSVTWGGTGTLANSAVLRFEGSSSLASLDQQGDLYLQGNPSGGHAYLTLSNPATNSGTIQLESTGGGYLETLTMAGGGLLGNSGSLVFAPGTGGSRFFDGALINDDQVQVQQRTTLRTGPITNRADFNVDPGVLLDFGPGVLFVQEAGSLTADGDYLLSAGSFELGDGLVSGSPVLRNSAVTVRTGSTATGELQIEGSSSTLAGDISAGLTLRLVGHSGAGHGTLTVPASLTNLGTLALESSSGAYQETLVVSPGAVLTNQGSLELLPGSGGSRYLDGEFINEGSADVAVATTFSTGPYTNRGALHVAQGTSLAFGSSVAFVQESGLLDVEGDLLLINGSFDLDGGTVQGPPRLRGCVLDIGPGATGPASLRTEGASTLTGDIAAATTLNVHGLPTGSHASLTLGSDVVNSGELRFDSEGGGYASSLVVPSGLTLTNQGNLRIEAGSGGSRFLDGALVNFGLLDLCNTLPDTAAARSTTTAPWRSARAAP